MLPEHKVALRRWLLTLPGVFRAEGYDDCLQEALAASGLDCDLGTFERLMVDAGYRPDTRRDPDNEGAYYCILALPEPSPGTDGGGGRR